MYYKSGKELLAEIRKIMDLKDIQIKELAVMTNKSQQSISQIFKVANPKYSTLIEICDALNISLDISLNDKES